MSEGARIKPLTFILPAVVVVGLVVAILIPVSGLTQTVTQLVARWFFAVFCTLYAVVQGRLYLKFRRAERAEAYVGVPIGAYAAFTVVWAVLAVAAILYGVFDVGGMYEAAGWVTIVLMICMQLIVLGRLDQRVQL
ncbi:MAG: hypothetical protein GTO46_15970 [Gemmatimonadetes bacterium]|nr:hypothetical protein [Gemmatimonadota bacterium]NIO33133.1 hypothetical protein [Gemmatimonadota bacterium]